MDEGDGKPAADRARVRVPPEKRLTGRAPKFSILCVHQRIDRHHAVRMEQILVEQQVDLVQAESVDFCQQRLVASQQADPLLTKAVWRAFTSRTAATAGAKTTRRVTLSADTISYW